MGIRVLVCGGRKFGDQALVNRVLDMLNTRLGIDVIIEGGAEGADELGKKWARAHEIFVETYLADWDRHDHNAGRIRNGVMLRKGKPDLVVAFKGGSGTRNMITLARTAGVRVLETWLYTGPFAVRE